MFIVIQDINPPNECDIVPEDAIYPATKKLVFGPASMKECEEWKEENCGPVLE